MLVISCKLNKTSKIIEISQKYDKVLLVTKIKDELPFENVMKVIKFNNVGLMWNKINTDSYYKDLFKQFDLIIFHMYSSELELDEYKKLELSIKGNIAVIIQGNSYCDIYEI